MLPEATEMITWELLSIETRALHVSWHVSCSQRLATPGKTIGKDHGGLPDPTQVGLVHSHMATLGAPPETQDKVLEGFS